MKSEKFQNYVFKCNYFIQGLEGGVKKGNSIAQMKWHHSITDSIT